MMVLWIDPKSSYHTFSMIGKWPKVNRSLREQEASKGLFLCVRYSAVLPFEKGNDTQELGHKNLENIQIRGVYSQNLASMGYLCYLTRFEPFFGPNM